MTIKELRKRTGFTQARFACYFGIPKRNIENWESEKNTCAPYLIALMEYKLKAENII